MAIRLAIIVALLGGLTAIGCGPDSRKKRGMQRFVTTGDPSAVSGKSGNIDSIPSREETSEISIPLDLSDKFALKKIDLTLQQVAGDDHPAYSGAMTHTLQTPGEFSEESDVISLTTESFETKDEEALKKSFLVKMNIGPKLQIRQGVVSFGSVSLLSTNLSPNGESSWSLSDSEGSGSEVFVSDLVLNKANEKQEEDEQGVYLLDYEGQSLEVRATYKNGIIRLYGIRHNDSSKLHFLLTYTKVELDTSVSSEESPESTLPAEASPSEASMFNSGEDQQDLAFPTGEFENSAADVDAGEYGNIWLPPRDDEKLANLSEIEFSEMNLSEIKVFSSFQENSDLSHEAMFSQELSTPGEMLLEDGYQLEFFNEVGEGLQYMIEFTVLEKIIREDGGLLNSTLKNVALEINNRSDQGQSGDDRDQILVFQEQTSVSSQERTHAFDFSNVLDSRGAEGDDMTGIYPLDTGEIRVFDLGSTIEIYAITQSEKGLSIIQLTYK